MQTSAPIWIRPPTEDPQDPPQHLWDTVREIVEESVSRWSRRQLVDLATDGRVLAWSTTAFTARSLHSGADQAADGMAPHLIATRTKPALSVASTSTPSTSTATYEAAKVLIGHAETVCLAGQMGAPGSTRALREWAIEEQASFVPTAHIESIVNSVALSAPAAWGALCAVAAELVRHPQLVNSLREEANQNPSGQPGPRACAFGLACTKAAVTASVVIDQGKQWPPMLAVVVASVFAAVLPHKHNLWAFDPTECAVATPLGPRPSRDLRILLRPHELPIDPTPPPFVSLNTVEPPPSPSAWVSMGAPTRSERVVVIGQGLAPLASAVELRRRGWEPTVLLTGTTGPQLPWGPLSARLAGATAAAVGTPLEPAPLPPWASARPDAALIPAISSLIRRLIASRGLSSPRVIDWEQLYAPIDKWLAARGLSAVLPWITPRVCSTLNIASLENVPAGYVLRALIDMAAAASGLSASPAPFHVDVDMYPDLSDPEDDVMLTRHEDSDDDEPKADAEATWATAASLTLPPTAPTGTSPTGASPRTSSPLIAQSSVQSAGAGPWQGAWAPRGGFPALEHALLAATGPNVQQNVVVSSVMRSADGVVVTMSGGETIRADRVILAVPATEALAMLGSSALKEELLLLPRISPYATSHDISLGLFERLRAIQGAQGVLIAAPELGGRLAGDHVALSVALIRSHFPSSLSGGKAGSAKPHPEQEQRRRRPLAPRPMPKSLGNACDKWGTLGRLLIGQWKAMKKNNVLHQWSDSNGKIVRSLHWDELCRQSAAVATQLLDRWHMRPGDRVLLVFPPGLSFVPALWGCIAAGVVAVPVAPPDPANVEPGLRVVRHIAADSGVRHALTDTLYWRATMLAGVRSTIGTAFSWFSGSTTDAEAAPSTVATTTLGSAISWISGTGGDTAGAFAGWPAGLQWAISDRLAVPSKESAMNTLERLTQSGSADDPCILQYTSGSTSNPRGVVLRHRNVLANLELMALAGDNISGHMCCSWLPHWHDFGLTGVYLNGVFGGGRSWGVHFSPVDFVRSPLTWLRLMHRNGATIALAPDFGFFHCARKIPSSAAKALNLSRVRSVCSGGEPVRLSTVSDFCERFHDTGFRIETWTSSWGMAELVVCANSSWRGLSHRGPATSLLTYDTRILESEGRVQLIAASQPFARTLLSCNQPGDYPNSHLVVIDPVDGRVCPDGLVGELWFSSKSVATGYWNREQSENDAQFAAAPFGESDPLCRYLRTGDLGFQWRGEVYVCGRYKELIIVAGRNVIPTDVEATAARAAGGDLRPGAVCAFSIEADAREKLIIVAEVRNAQMPKASLARITQLISAAVASEHQIAPQAVVLIAPHSMPKTTSGKLQRGRLKQLWLSQKVKALYTEHSSELSAPVLPPQPPLLPPEESRQPEVQPQQQQQQISGPPPPDSVSDEEATLIWVSTLLAEEAGVTPVDVRPEVPMSAYLPDSAAAVAFAHRLSDLIGHEVPPSSLYVHPTARALSLHVRALRMGLSPTPTSGVGEDVENTKHSGPLAVVGIACRLPGGVDTPEGLWQVLSEGAVLTSPISSRLAGATGPSAGLLNDDQVQGFDAKFFGLSAAEAAAIDPQHRLMLETSWEALARAGRSPGSPRFAAMRGSWGVFIGASGSEYVSRIGRSSASHRAGRFAAAGASSSAAAGRLAYHLGLGPCGPAMVVDTACSSSMVALHLARRALVSGECSAALVGGVNVLADPNVFAVLHEAGVLSPTGHCHPFDQSADGYVRSEGAVTLVLRRLTDALADGDPVHAVLLGTAINHNGSSSNGLAAPSAQRQAAVIRSAMREAGVTESDVGAVESHGTGTALGDPVEAAGLADAFSRRQHSDSPLMLGSIKATLGHTEAAAGLVGVLKAVLSVHRGMWPGQAKGTFTTLSPAVGSSLDHIGAVVAREGEPLPWPTMAEGMPRVVGVSSFGITGTNAHAVFAQPPNLFSTPDTCSASTLVLPIAAHSASALSELANRWNSSLGGTDNDGLIRTACNWAVAGGAPLTNRVAIFSNTPTELLSRLKRFAESGGKKQKLPGVVCGSRQSHGRVAFLFTGQGSRWNSAAGPQLFSEHESFREAIIALDEPLAPLIGGRASEILFGASVELPAPPTTTMDESVVTPTVPERESKGAWWLGEQDIARVIMLRHVALFCLQIGLAAVWKSRNVNPAYVLGHSSGEVAAAALSGALSMSAAAQLAAERGRLLGRLASTHASIEGAGSMAAVRGVPVAIVQKFVSEADGSDVEVAAFNGPLSVVLAGQSRSNVEHVLESIVLAAPHAEWSWLPVPVAFHSPVVAPVLDELESAASAAMMRYPTLPNTDSPSLVSTLTGMVADSTVITPKHWRDHARLPVQFLSGMQSLDATTLIELGPHPVLARLGPACLEDEKALFVSSLDARMSAPEALTEAMAKAWTAGVMDSLPSVNTQPPSIPLPSYPFQRTKHWLIEDGDHDFQDSSNLFTLDWIPAEADTTEPTGRKLMAIIAHSSATITLANQLASHLETMDAVAEVLVLDEAPWDVRLRDLAQRNEMLLSGAVVIMGDDTAENVDGLKDRWHASLVSVAQAMLALQGRLFMVTQGDGLSSSAGWGFIRSAALESPGLVGGAWDVTPSTPMAAVAALISQQPLDDWQAKVTEDGSRLVPRILPFASHRHSSTAIKCGSRSTAVFIGGLAGSAVPVASWLVANTDIRRIVVTTRGTPRAKVLDSLKATGAAIDVVIWDASSSPHSLLSALSLPLDSIGCIVVLSGGASLAPLHSMSWADSYSTLSPKVNAVLAAEHLANSINTPLPLGVILFSSASAQWGDGSGLSHYAAANAAADAVVRRMRQTQPRAISISWGLLAPGGMTSLEATRRAEAFGMKALSSAGMMSCLSNIGLALDADLPPSIIAAEMDWHLFNSVTDPIMSATLTSRLPGGKQGEKSEQVSQQPEDPGHALKALLPFIGSFDLLRFVATQIAIVLDGRGEDPAATLDGVEELALTWHSNVWHLGIDSLMTVQLARRLEASLSITLPPEFRRTGSLLLIHDGVQQGNLALFRLCSPHRCGPQCPSPDEPVPEDTTPGSAVPIGTGVARGALPGDVGDDSWRDVVPDTSNLAQTAQTASQAMDQAFEKYVRELLAKPLGRDPESLEMDEELVALEADMPLTRTLQRRVLTDLKLDMPVRVLWKGPSLGKVLTAIRRMSVGAPPDDEGAARSDLVSAGSLAPSGGFRGGHVASRRQQYGTPWLLGFPVPPGSPAAKAREGPARVRLFVFPLAGGNPALFRNWGALLPDVEVVCVHPPGRTLRFEEPPIKRVEPLAEAIATQVARIHDGRPFAFYGHCAGAMVAFETCRELRRRGCALPGLLVAAASPPPDVHNPNLPPPGAGQDELAGRLIRLFGGETGDAFWTAERGAYDEWRHIVAADMEALDAYTRHGPPKEDPLPIPIVAVGGRSDAFVDPNCIGGWERHAVTFHNELVDGGHLFALPARATVSEEEKLVEVGFLARLHSLLSLI